MDSLTALVARIGSDPDDDEGLRQKKALLVIVTVIILPISLAWGRPMRFEGLARGGRGYREASGQIEREIRRLWEWLVTVHADGRPEGLTPP